MSPVWWLRVFARESKRALFRFRQQAPPRNKVRLGLEALETRDLLSVFAPTYLVDNPAQAPSPLAGAGPAGGYTPAQVRHAYGFDQTSFPGGVPGDGSGTTIAIVDAYDDPTAASDLHQFDLRFGLPDPPTFTK